MLTFKKHKFIVIMSAIFIAFAAVELINDKFALHDFEVSYTAAKNLVSGKAVYGQAFGLDSGIYKYSPFMLFFVLPYTVMPYHMAKTVHFFSVAALIIFTVIYTERFIRQTFFDSLDNKSDRIWFLAVLVAGIHFYRELHLGNWNVHLLILSILVLRLIIKNKVYTAGAILAWMILMKPHFIIFIPLLLMRKKIKTVGGVLAGIVAGLNFPALFLGMQYNIELHTAWFNTIIGHNASFTRDASCIYALLYNSIMKYVLPEAGTYYTSLLLFIVAMLFMLFVIGNFRAEHQYHRPKVLGENNFIFEYFLLLAILPSVTITDTQHYLWSLPVIIFIIACRVYGARRRDGVFYVAILGFLLYGGNIYDLWGREISVWMNRMGFIGIGNILTMLSALLFFSRWRAKFIANRQANPKAELLVPDITE